MWMSTDFKLVSALFMGVLDDCVLRSDSFVERLWERENTFGQKLQCMKMQQFIIYEVLDEWAEVNETNKPHIYEKLLFEHINFVSFYIPISIVIKCN